MDGFLSSTLDVSTPKGVGQPQGCRWREAFYVVRQHSILMRMQMDMFNFVHKRAVGFYKSELKQLIEFYASLDKDLLADYFIFSVWTRAGLQNEGRFRLPGGEDYMSSELGYFMLTPLQSVIKTYKRRGATTEAAALSIWAHSARGVVNAEMEDDLQNLWELIMSTQEFWDKHLNKLYNEYKNSGMASELLDATLALSKRILADTPPEQYRKKGVANSVHKRVLDTQGAVNAKDDQEQFLVAEDKSTRAMIEGLNRWVLMEDIARQLAAHLDTSLVEIESLGEVFKRALEQEVTGQLNRVDENGGRPIFNECEKKAKEIVTTFCNGLIGRHEEKE